MRLIDSCSCLSMSLMTFSWQKKKKDKKRKFKYIYTHTYFFNIHPLLTKHINSEINLMNNIFSLNKMKKNKTFNYVRIHKYTIYHILVYIRGSLLNYCFFLSSVRYAALEDKPRLMQVRSSFYFPNIYYVRKIL